ncbi:hypothetical protein QE382_004366 [Sphingobacterium zeae]|uniref:Phosphate-selective porin O and P n=1 Tax=Sphingobacterium zeae TaxID=1776859 RepID=A0ABU0UBZ8_9SPHI|nr:hypothetical protein [Sphingobacterium zeae]MDQ1152382.1 hypothetical protein [Sphingobacterium zeae]
MSKVLFFLIFVSIYFGSSTVYSQGVLKDEVKPEIDSVGNNRSIFGKVKTSFSMDVLTFSRNLRFRENEHTVNFENRVAKLDRGDFGAYFRPLISFEIDNIKLDIQPRLNTEYDQINKEYVLDNFFFQKFKADVQLGTKVKLSGGRYFKTIGTSLITNPSNLFFIETNPINPKLEIAPKDFFEIAFSATKDLNINLIANLGKGEDKYYVAPYFDFKRQYGVQVDFYSGSFQNGLIFSIDESKRWGVGTYGQKTVGNSLVFWIDANLKYKPNRFYSQIPMAPEIRDIINYEMVNGEENSHVYVQGLFGMSYTFNFGPTLNLEYYHNGIGYNRSQLDRYWTMIYQASDYNFDISEQLSNRNMGRAINPGMQFIRKNYIFSQFGQNDLFGKLNFFVRYLNCLDDKSQQLSALIEYNLSNRLELFTTVLFNPTRNTKTDFGRLVKNQIMTGLIYRL